LDTGGLEHVRTQLIRRLVVLQRAIDGHPEEGRRAGTIDTTAARERRATQPASKPDTPKTRKRASRPGTNPAPAGA
jgi:hypothetical protein